MNEPHDQSASDWLGSANAAIAAIRSAGAVSQEILVPGSYWDGAWTWTSTDNAAVIGTGVQDPAHNFAFEVHQYLDFDGSGTHPGVVSPTIGVERLTAITQWAEATGNHLFLGEVGVTTDQTSLTAFDGMLTYMQQHSGRVAGSDLLGGRPVVGRLHVLDRAAERHARQAADGHSLAAPGSAPGGDYNGTSGVDSFSATGESAPGLRQRRQRPAFSFIGNQNLLSGGNGNDALRVDGTEQRPVRRRRQ